MRFVAETLHCRMVNTAGVDADSDERFIWVFWHNRMFLMPWMWDNIFPARQAVILTSPSGDGEVIAQTCAAFRLRAARGSSSRRGGQAMVELARYAKNGHDIGVTPDGPRGPKYKMNLGVIKLAQLTGLRLLPLHVRYDNAFKLKTWDSFMLPVPGSDVEIEFGQPYTVPRRTTEEEAEDHRANLERIMIEGTHEFPAGFPVQSA